MPLFHHHHQHYWSSATWNPARTRTLGHPTSTHLHIVLTMMTAVSLEECASEKAMGSLPRNLKPMPHGSRPGSYLVGKGAGTSQSRTATRSFSSGKKWHQVPSPCMNHEHVYIPPHSRAVSQSKGAKARGPPSVILRPHYRIRPVQ